MLGTACFRLCGRGSHCVTTVSISHSHHSGPYPHSSPIICRHATPLSFSRSTSWPRHQPISSTEVCGLQGASSVKRSCYHTSSCVEGGHELSCATIWHGLLPSHHPSILDQNVVSQFKGSCAVSSFDTHLESTCGHSLTLSCKHEQPDSTVGISHASSCRVKCALSFPNDTRGSMGRFAMTTGLFDGSWNVAWDARPARWLHGRHSAWLLFGVCTCFSAAAGLSAPNVLSSSPVNVQSSKLAGLLQDSTHEMVDAAKAVQGKQVYTDYSVTGIPGDGRCLFRAIAHGSHLTSGKPAPDESLQRELADDLRSKVVDELVSRQAESEWFIEEDFDTYVTRMREHHVWGGEPELLMASHVLKKPITVHLYDRSSGGLISIAEYGLEYGGENPIRVLYHGFGHYDAVQIPSIGTASKL